MFYKAPAAYSQPLSDLLLSVLLAALLSQLCMLLVPLPSAQRPLQMLQVGLMSQGVLDADVYPEVAKAILSALWLATEHPARQVRACRRRLTLLCNLWWPAHATCSSNAGLKTKINQRRAPQFCSLSALFGCPHPAASAQVRRQAYLSLAEYSLGLQEQLEALPPLIDFVELLARERAAPNCAACEGLVAAALAYEYAT